MLTPRFPKVETVERSGGKFNTVARYRSKNLYLAALGHFEIFGVVEGVLADEVVTGRSRVMTSSF
jgi:hypothetical protein